MSILLLTSDLLASSQIGAAASQRGLAVGTMSSARELLDKAAREPVANAVIDLSLPGIDIRQVVQELRGLPAPPRCIIAFAPHVHTQKLAAATDAGCDHVTSRGQLVRDLAQILDSQRDAPPA